MLTDTRTEPAADKPRRARGWLLAAAAAVVVAAITAAAVPRVGDDGDGDEGETITADTDAVFSDDFDDDAGNWRSDPDVTLAIRRVERVDGNSIAESATPSPSLSGPRAFGAGAGSPQAAASRPAIFWTSAFAWQPICVPIWLVATAARIAATTSSTPTYSAAV